MVNTKGWKEFKLTDLFHGFERGKRLVEFNREPGNTPLVTAGFQNEGVSDFISNFEQKRYCNKITIDMFCNVFYRDYEFCCDDNILVLINDELNANVCLFLVSIIRKDKFRFAYGRQYRQKDYLKHTIKLPANSEGNPDFEYMNSYIEKLQSRERESGKSIKESLNTKYSKEKFVISNWSEFKINDLFECYLSQGDLKETECANGSIPLISSGDNNNGCVKYIDKNGDGKAKIFNGNCLTLDMFCKAFYQEKPFYAVSHGCINVLLPKIKFNKYIGLFIATIINHERFRFSYGRAVYSNVACNITIKLPVKNGTINYLYIENFIKSLPYADRI